MSDLLAKLSEYDFIAVIDASGSMSTEDMPGGRSRWQFMQETAAQFCRDLGKLDADGIDVVVFSGAGTETHTGVTADKVTEIFRTRSPRSSTPLHLALEAALKCAGKSAKKDFVIVFTDGEPDDEEAAKNVIRRAANGLESDDDLTFLFVQVGRDPGATRFLKTLDDGLNTKFDIVDAKTMDEAEKFATTAELIVAAIND
jgi:Mg-chelatase subunit ChlD